MITDDKFMVEEPLDEMLAGLDSYTVNFSLSIIMHI